MKYKAIKIVHTELSIADNLINKFTEKKKKTLLFLYHPLGFLKFFLHRNELWLLLLAVLS